MFFNDTLLYYKLLCHITLYILLFFSLIYCTALACLNIIEENSEDIEVAFLIGSKMYMIVQYNTVQNGAVYY